MSAVSSPIILDMNPSPLQNSIGSDGTWNFKRIKQHLHIKSFYGTSENVFYTQIWISVSAFLLLTIAKKLIHIEELSLYIISQNIGTMLFKKIPIPELFNKPINNAPRMMVNLIYFKTSNLHETVVMSVCSLSCTSALCIPGVGGTKNS